MPQILMESAPDRGRIAGRGLIFAEGRDKLERMQRRYGGYWRFPKLLDYCYLVNPYFPSRALADEPRRENAPPASRSWLAKILLGRRGLEARNPGGRVVDAAEHRRWLEWAETYMAMPPERDEDAS